MFCAWIYLDDELMILAEIGVIVITMHAHGNGLNFIAAPQHSPVSPRESTYQPIPP